MKPPTSATKQCMDLIPPKSFAPQIVSVHAHPTPKKRTRATFAFSCKPVTGSHSSLPPCLGPAAQPITRPLAVAAGKEVMLRAH